VCASRLFFSLSHFFFFLCIWNSLTFKKLTEFNCLDQCKLLIILAHSSRLIVFNCIITVAWPNPSDPNRQMVSSVLSQATWQFKNEQWKFSQLNYFLFCSLRFVFSLFFLRVRQPAKVNCLLNSAHLGNVLSVSSVARWQQFFREQKTLLSADAEADRLVRSHELLTVRFGSSRLSTGGWRLIFFTWRYNFCTDHFKIRLDIHPRLSLMVHWPFSLNWWTCAARSCSVNPVKHWHLVRNWYDFFRARHLRRDIFFFKPI